MIDKSERRFHNLMESKKEQAWVLNKHKASNEAAKEFTWKLWNIMNLLILFTLEQNS